MGSSEDPSLVNNVDELGLVYEGLTTPSIPTITQHCWYEAMVEWYWQAESGTLGKILSQYHFVQHKSHKDCRGIKPGPPRCQADDWPTDPWHGSKIL